MSYISDLEDNYIIENISDIISQVITIDEDGRLINELKERLIDLNNVDGDRHDVSVNEMLSLCRYMRRINYNSMTILSFNAFVELCKSIRYLGILAWYDLGKLMASTLIRQRNIKFLTLFPDIFNPYLKKLFEENTGFESNIQFVYKRYWGLTLDEFIRDFTGTENEYGFIQLIKSLDVTVGSLRIPDLLHKITGQWKTSICYKAAIQLYPELSFKPAYGYIRDEIHIYENTFWQIFLKWCRIDDIFIEILVFSGWIGEDGKQEIMNLLAKRKKSKKRKII